MCVADQRVGIDRALTIVYPLDWCRFGSDMPSALRLSTLQPESNIVGLE